jgi:hypothetical protein
MIVLLPSDQSLRASQIFHSRRARIPIAAIVKSFGRRAQTLSVERVHNSALRKTIGKD